MSEYTAQIEWQKGADEKYIDNKYSRGHQWHFDGGSTVMASASPHIVPLPYSIAENVDPEEAFIASISSCHMLFFLSIAAKKRWVVDKYIDNAVGIMEQDNEEKTSMTQIKLKPKVVFTGEKQPTYEQLDKAHHQAHAMCFLANSVKTEIVTEIVL